jgi:hypothetical protein
MDNISIYSDEYGIPLTEGKIKELTIDKEPLFWEDFLVPVLIVKDDGNEQDSEKDKK